MRRCTKEKYDLGIWVTKLFILGEKTQISLFYAI